METDALYSEMSKDLQLIGHWASQHFLVVIPLIIVVVGLLRTVVTGEIEFRNGSFIERSRRPLLFWATTVFFGGFAALIAFRFYQAGF